MNKTFGITVSTLITTVLLLGCAPKEKKVSLDAIAQPTQNLNTQVQEIAPRNESDAASSPTKPSIENKPVTIEKVNGVEKLYVAKPVNILQDDWLTNLAGGRKNSITIRIGQVMHDNSQKNIEEFIEEYIEFECNGNKITLIENGARFEYKDGTNQIKRKTLNFLTGKKLNGKEVVKNYSDKSNKIVLIIDFNDKGSATQAVIFCSQNDNEDIPNSNFYELEVNG